MEVSKLRNIYSGIYGSRLYGTHSDISDVDIKTVYIPDIKECIRCNTAIMKSERNEFECNNQQYEEERMSIQKFLSLAKQGQTMAFDMLWSPVKTCSDEWKHVLSFRYGFISKNMNAFMGYATSQALKYSNKGKNINDISSFVEYLNKIDKLNSKTINDMFESNSFNQSDIDEWCNEHNVSIKSNHITVGNFTFPISKTIKSLINALNCHIDKYGTRAEKAAEFNGFDYKAISHAYRILDELEELIDYRSITFPLVNAKYIKDIKYGRVDNMQKVVDELIERTKHLGEKLKASDLPETSTINTDKILFDLYDIYYDIN